MTQPNDDGKNSDKPNDAKPFSRRDFLKTMGLMVAAAGTSKLLSACQPETPAGVVGASLSTDEQYPSVPPAPDEPPSADRLRFFTVHEARTVEALAATILPGTPDDPGAREAGVLTFIDYWLARDDGYNQPFYRMPPFAEAYEGDTPPPETLGNGFNVIWVPEAQMDRYGPQTIMTPRDMYRAGLVSLDRYANEKFGRGFVDLAPGEQEAIVDDLANDKATGFASPSAEGFFDMVRDDVINGMFSDPLYGGNRGMVGWKLLGYPGAQRAYTPEEMARGTQREPQGLAQLPHFHPGEPAPNVILPVAGSTQQGMVPAAPPYTGTQSP